MGKKKYIEKSQMGPKVFKVPLWTMHIKSIRKIRSLNVDESHLNSLMLISIAAAVEGYVKFAIEELDFFISSRLHVEQSAMNSRTHKFFRHSLKKSSWKELKELTTIYLGWNFTELVSNVMILKGLEPDERKRKIAENNSPIETLFMIRNKFVHGQVLDISKYIEYTVYDDELSEEVFIESEGISEILNYLKTNNLISTSDYDFDSFTITDEYIEHFISKANIFLSNFSGGLNLWLMYGEYRMDLRKAIVEPFPTKFSKQSIERIHHVLWGIDNCFDLDQDWDFDFSY